MYVRLVVDFSAILAQTVLSNDISQSQISVLCNTSTTVTQYIRVLRVIYWIHLHMDIGIVNLGAAAQEVIINLHCSSRDTYATAIVTVYAGLRLFTRPQITVFAHITPLSLEEFSSYNTLPWIIKHLNRCRR